MRLSGILLEILITIRTFTSLIQLTKPFEHSLEDLQKFKHKQLFQYVKCLEARDSQAIYGLTRALLHWERH